MLKSFFSLTDNFESIIKTQLKSVKTITKIPTGWTNYVFQATTNKNINYIFRFPRNDFFSKVLKKEVSFNKFIKNKIKVKTANLQYKFHNGRGFTMHKMLNGNVLTNAYPLLTKIQKQQLAADISDYLNSLQKIKSDEFKLETLTKFLIGLSKVNNSNYDYKILLPLMEMESTKIISHGDLNPGNILLDSNNRLFAVLDYAFVSYSCVENDLSRLVGRLPNDFYKIMLKEYKKKTKNKINKNNVNKLIKIWKYVEADYISYMKKHHSDVVLPNL